MKTQNHTFSSIREDLRNRKIQDKKNDRLILLFFLWVTVMIGSSFVSNELYGLPIKYILMVVVSLFFIVMGMIRTQINVSEITDQEVKNEIEARIAEINEHHNESSFEKELLESKLLYLNDTRQDLMILSLPFK